MYQNPHPFHPKSIKALQTTSIEPILNIISIITIFKAHRIQLRRVKRKSQNNWFIHTKAASPNLEFLIKIGKNEGSLVHQCFASTLLLIQPLAHPKLTSHCQNPSFPPNWPFICVLIKGLKAKTKNRLYGGFNSYSMVLT